MKIVVLNYCGTVGKTTAAAHLFAPRIPGARIFAIETINETAADLGLEIDKLKGDKFGVLFKELLRLDAAIIDVGASNIEDFLAEMVKYSDSHEEFDYFVIPITPGGKEQKESLKTIQALKGVGVDSSKIRVLFNRVNSSTEDEFPAVFGFAQTTNYCVARPDAAIFENDVFDLLSAKRTTISAVLEDETDYRELIRKPPKDTDEATISDWCDMQELKVRSRSVHIQLNTAFAALFSEVPNVGRAKK